MDGDKIFWSVTPQEYASLAEAIESHFQRDVVRAWFPRCIDQEKGGFHASWGRDWTKKPSTGRFCVFQSRCTWIASQIAIHRPALRQEFLGYARHGLRFLDQVQWDRENGGFFWGLTDEGTISPALGAEKCLYGQAFGLYAAAAAYEATQDPIALNLAQQAFAWLETNAHDRQNGGYHEIYTREGRVLFPDEPITPRSKRFSGGAFLYGHKSMNAHIHILEALASLYHVWKDATAQARLRETLAIVRDRVCVEPGCMNLWFTPDWRPLPDHDSIGHDVETGFLLLEAEEALGEHDPRTARMARMLVDHSLAWGWDEQYGGFYDKGAVYARAHDTTKIWWTEVEGLNALLLMHERHGQETDRYWRAFLQQWQFIERYMLDKEFGGIYESTEAQGKPIRTDKGHNWKAGYHDGRSLLLVGERLKRLAEEKAKA